MYQIIYGATALTPFTPADLEELLRKSREKNRMLKISGLMLYKDGSFIQVLEGPDKEVRELYATIELDFRLQTVICLSQKAIEEREFGERPMGFANVTALTEAERPDLAYFRAESMTPETLATKPNRARELLELFRRNMT